MKNVINEIRANIGFYSSVERKLADMILENPQRFIAFSTSELAKSAGVSQGSINNFAKKLTGSGFSELKLNIAAALPEYDKKPFNIAENGDGFFDVCKKISDDVSAAFENTISMNTEESFEKAAGLIMGAEKTEIYGIYQSGIVGNDFNFRLIQLGLPSVFVNDVLMCSVSASMLKKGDLVVAVSSSGQTKDVIDAVKIAKEKGTSVLGITSNKGSMLAKLSDVCLISAPGGASISSRLEEIRYSQLFIIDTLCSYIRNKIDKTGDKQYYRLKDILQSHSIDD